MNIGYSCSQVIEEENQLLLAGGIDTTQGEGKLTSAFMHAFRELFICEVNTGKNRV